MPYIKKGDKKKLDKALDKLSEAMCDYDIEASDEGVLAYVITWLLDSSCLHGEGYASFADYAKAIGIIDCVKEEFRRRRLNPYEDKKCEENGDVYQ